MTARALRIRSFVVVLVAAAVSVASPGAGYTASRPATAVQHLQRAAALVGKIPASKFGAGRRALIVREARVAVRTVRTTRACAALAAADDLLSALRAPGTWHKRLVPRGLIARPLSELTSAETLLLRKAGSPCATRVKWTVRRKVHSGGQGFVPLPAPAEGNAQGVGPRTPAGVFRRPKHVGKPIEIGSGPLGGLTSASGRTAFAATAPLTFFRVTDLGPQNCCGDPKEPTTAIGKNVVWYTGNSMVALSTDAGRTFSYFDPSTILPDQGLPFCCDQQVAYSAKYNLFVWLMQYDCAVGTSSPPTNNCLVDSTGANRVRIAFASPEELMAHSIDPGNAWAFFDNTPQDFGEPASAWFDRSSLSLNDSSVNWQVDIMRGKAGDASLLAQVPLSDLALAGKVTVYYGFDPHQRMEVAQGLGSTTYYVGANSMSQTRIVSRAANSMLLFRHEVDHSSVPNCEWKMRGTTGVDWYGRIGHWPGLVESATVSGSTLYVAQGAARSYCNDLAHPVLTQPGVFISEYDVNSWKNVDELWLYNGSEGFMWPALQTDGAGEVGIALHAAALGDNARAVAGFLTPVVQVKWAAPVGGYYLTGDYYSLRPGETPHSFVMTGESVQNDAGTQNMHWLYFEYGHGPAPFIAPPNVSITAPKDQANIKQGTVVTYTGLVYDPVWGSLPKASIVWKEDGTAIGTGPQITHTEATSGAHMITLTATNGDGKAATASITINVLAPPPAGSPIPWITSPPDSKSFCANSMDSQNHWYRTVQLQATATDPNNPPQALSYTWSDSINGGFPIQVSTDLSPSLNLYYSDSGGAYKPTTHDLTLTATNTSGKTGVTKIRLYVGWPCIG